MERKEALYQINVEIERVNVLDSFAGKASLLKRLVHLYDLIDLYKPTPAYYKIVVKEAKSLLSKLQRKLDDEAKGGK